MVTLYDGSAREEWLAELVNAAPHNRRLLLALYAVLGIPEKHLDVGCGDGTMVRTALMLGVDAVGVDQLVEANSQHFYHHNLVDVFDLKHGFDLVTCFEVAEHLDPSAHASLCESLTANLAEGRGHYLVFTSAHPGQGGNGHLSERPAAYWHNEFSLRHLNFRRDLTTELALVWSNIDTPLYWMAANVMVFEK